MGDTIMQQFYDTMLHIQIGRPLAVTRNTAIKGCTFEEIHALKVAQKVSCLPELYIEFLVRMGHGAGLMFKGSDYSYEHILTMKQNAIKKLSYDKIDFDLPADAFVFFMHHGYEFRYFLTENCPDDPPVYLYSEGRGHPVIAWDHLSGHYTAYLEYIKRLTE